MRRLAFFRDRRPAVRWRRWAHVGAAGHVLLLAVPRRAGARGGARLLLRARRRRARPGAEHGHRAGAGRRRLRLGRHAGRPAPLRRPALHRVPAGSARRRQPARQLRHRARRRTAGRALWVGTYSQYVARLDLAHRPHPPLRGGGRRSRRRRAPGVRGAAPKPTRSGSATAHGLDRLDPRQRPRTSRAGARRRTARPASRRRCCATAQGALWYATAAGLYRLDRDGGTPVAVGPATPLRALLRDRSGRLWAGGSDGLFLVSDRRTLVPAWPRSGRAPAATSARWPKRPTGACGSRSPPPACAGSIRAAATAQAAARRIRDCPATLPEDGINALMIDRAGLLWVGGQLRGAAVADSRGARFRYLVDVDPATPGRASHRQQHPRDPRRRATGACGSAPTTAACCATTASARLRGLQRACCGRSRRVPTAPCG